MNHDLNKTSGITQKITGWMNLIGIPVSIVSVMVLFLFLTIFKNIVSSVSKYAFTKIHYRVFKEIIFEVYENFLSASWPFFLSKDYGVLGNTLFKETEKIGGSFEIIANILSRFFRAVFYIAIAFFLSWKLTLIVIALIAFFLIPFSMLGKLTYKMGKIHTVASNQFQGLVLESFGAAKLILGSANQDKSLLSIFRSINPFINSAVQFIMVRAITPLAYEPLGLIVVLSAVYLGIYQFNLNVSEIFIMLYAFRMASSLGLDITNDKNYLQNLAPALEQVYRLKEEAEKKKQFTGDQQFTKLSNNITFKNVTFSYPNRDQALMNVSLSIAKGNLVAIIGRSGAGKTTLVDVLMGFYKADHGEVLIDDVLITDLDIKSYRKKIGFVPQEPFLFNMSIRDNLLWNYEFATEKDLYNACELANANEFLQKLPNGLGTIVGDRGIRLSGGQRQRLALARALLRKPEILILDEATSSLDSHSEELIQRSIENIADNTTIVVIAHRLSTIKLADFIYVLDNGSIVESGTFDQLIKIKEGSFLKTARLQGITQATTFNSER